MKYFRESDLQKFYDDPFVDQNESEMNGGVDNHIVQSQPLKSRGVYEYKDSPGKYQKSHSDLSSVRSPSSLGMTHTTKLGSQSSLKSAISMKESPSLPAVKEIPPEKKEKYQEREVDVRSDKSEVTDKSSIFSSTTTNNSSKHDFLTSSPVPRARTPRSTKSSRTILDAGGVPQTEV